MTETKNKNGKSSVCRNDDLGMCHKIPDRVGDDGLIIGSACHKLPDQVGDDGLTVGSGCSKIPDQVRDDRKVKYSGMMGKNAGTASSSSFLGLTRESLDDKKIPAFAGMTGNIRSTGMTENIRGAGMRENIRGAGMTGNIGSAGMTGREEKTSFLGLTRESLDIRSESGKSMVEMLGVLALMGLLAVLGAKGYSMAMERVAATTIINDISKRAMIYSQQLMAGAELKTDEMPAVIHNVYPVGAERFGEQFFKITVQDVDRPVCEYIAKSGFATPIQIAANNTVVSSDNIGACNNNNNLVDMTFTFTRTLRPCSDCLSGVKTCETDSQCASNQTCQNGMCLCSPYYACNGTCCPAGQFCVNGQCSANDGCQSTDDCDQGLCISGKCQCRSYRDNCTYFCEMKDQYYGVCSTGAYYEEGAFSMAGTVWSTKTLNWYTASDFCASLGKEMVSLEDLGCVADGDTYTCTIPEKFKGHGNVWTTEWKDGLKVWCVNTTSGGVWFPVWWGGGINALCR